MPDPANGTGSASTRPVILASASPRRSALLKEAGPMFATMRIMTADVEEGDDPLENAMRKAEAVARLNPQALEPIKDFWFTKFTQYFFLLFSFNEAILFKDSIR